MDTTETERFEALTAPYRREMFAHCYRMTGSVHDAEDLVQETYVRAWRAFDRFEQRSSVRTWTYRIATNVCLTALEGRRRRPLPSALASPSDDPYAALRPAAGDVPWLEPVPDRLVVDERGDPADIAAARQRVRLALVAALQLLPARQRAALILCEVLAWPAADAAALLQVSTPAVKSLLQRARARLAESAPTDDDLAEPTDWGARQVLDAYIDAFERSDIGAMERLLADDAVLEMTGTTRWFAGKATCLPFIATQAIGVPGEWRLMPVAANGQLGAAAYRLGDDGHHHAFAIVVLATTSTALRRITLFSGERAFSTFELPLVAPVRLHGRRGRIGMTPSTAPSPTVAERAATLRSLHRPGDPLVLVNAWDVASALTVVAAGGQAIATSSAAIAASFGVPDDDTMDPDVAFGAIARIAAAVTVPVTADLEAGYGMPADELVERLIGAGGAGCNIEDTDHRNPGNLVDADMMAGRIAAVREAAARHGVPVVVNARVDVLVRGGFDSRPLAIAEVVRRARRYREAGADCVYPIGLAGREEAAHVVAEVGGWVNGNVGPNVTVAQMAAAGVSRISVGPTYQRRAMADLAERASELLGR